MVFSALFQNRMEKVSAFDLYIGTKDRAHLAAYQAYLDRAVPVTSARQYSIYQGENAQAQRRRITPISRDSTAPERERKRR